MKLICITILFTLLSCGKNDKTSKTNFSILGANSTTLYSNGIVINGFKIGSNERFTMAIGDSNPNLERDLSTGNWNFSVIGWQDSGTGENFEGVPKCGSIQKELVLVNETIEITLDSSNCAQSEFNNNSSNFDSSGLFKKLSLVGCITLEDSNITSNGNCHFNKELLGASLSYQIIFFNSHNDINIGPVLKSRCLHPTDILQSNIDTEVRIPIGGAANSFPMYIQGYEKNDCTEPDAKYLYLNGLGNNSALTGQTIQDYSYTTDQTKVYLADNYMGVGSTPFLNQVMKFDCNGVHCLDTPTKYKPIFGNFDSINSYAKIIYGTVDGLDQEQLERPPLVTIQDGSGNGLIIELASYDSNHLAYTINFLTGTPSAVYTSGTKTLDVTLATTSETIDNIYSLITSVTEYNVYKFGVTTNSLTIGSEIPATTNLSQGTEAKPIKNREFGLIGEHNFFLLGPFGALLAKNGYTKCDSSGDPNDVYSAIGQSFSMSLSNNSIKVDVSSASIDLTGVAGPSLSGLRLTYTHNGNIIGASELSCDGTYNKAGWFRLIPRPDEINEHNLELYYNDGNGADSKYELYTKSLDCNSNCILKSFIRMEKNSAQSFKLWVTAGYKNSSSINNYVRYASHIDAGLDEFSLNTFVDGNTFDTEPSTLATYTSYSAPNYECKDKSGVTTTCSFNATDPALNPTSNPILLSDWSTSKTDLDSTFLEDLFEVLP